MPEYNHPDTKKMPYCYYCGKLMREGVGSGTWECGTPTKGVGYFTGEDEETADYICIYERIGDYEYLARHYLPNHVGSKKNMCELDIYDLKKDEYMNSFPITQ